MPAIVSTAVVGLFSFIFSVNSDVAVLQNQAVHSKETNELILKEIRFVKVNQMKVHEKVIDTRDRVIKLEVKLDERETSK